MTSSLPGAQSVPAGPRVADLQLRGRAGPLRTRVHWPPATGGPAVRPLLVMLTATGADDLWATVSAKAGVVVLAVSDTRVTRVADEAALAEATTALQWAADHADELHADPGRLVVGGEGTGAWLAAAVALEARDDGWPSVVRQLLMVTTTSDTAAAAARSVPQVRGPSLAGVAPAIVVTIGDGPHEVDARRYASTAPGRRDPRRRAPSRRSCRGRGRLPGADAPAGPRWRERGRRHDRHRRQRRRPSVPPPRPTGGVSPAGTRATSPAASSTTAAS